MSGYTIKLGAFSPELLGQLEEINQHSKNLLDFAINQAVKERVAEQERKTKLYIRNGKLVAGAGVYGKDQTMATFTQGKFVVHGTAEDFARSKLSYYLLHCPMIVNKYLSMFNFTDLVKQAPNLIKSGGVFYFEFEYNARDRTFEVLSIWNTIGMGPSTQAYTSQYHMNHANVSPELFLAVINLTSGFTNPVEEIPLVCVLDHWNQQLEVKFAAWNPLKPLTTMVTIQQPNNKLPTALDILKQYHKSRIAPKNREVCGVETHKDSVDVISALALSRHWFHPQEGFAPSQREKQKEALSRNRIIMFNGPPRSGKDSACDIIAEIKPDVICVNFKDILYKESASMLGLNTQFWADICQNGDLKDKPMLWVGNNDCGAYMTPREILIHHAEKIIKPEKGIDYIAKVTAEHIAKITCDLKEPWVVVIPDLGFEYEQSVMQNTFKDKNVDVITVRINRPDHTYANDSRNYVDQFDHLLENNHDLEQYKENVKTFFGDVMMPKLQQ